MLSLFGFLKIAFASSSELETQLIISERLGFISKQKFDKIESKLTEVRMMLNKFISNLQNTVLSAKD